MRLLITIIIPFICLIGKSQAINNYEEALSIVSSDTILLSDFCSSNNQFGLEVFEKHNFFASYYFAQKLASQKKIPLNTAEKILSRADRKVKGEKDRLDYREMSDELKSEFSNINNPCAIICFDRIREGFLLAEITYFLEAESWADIRNHQTSFFLLFDFNTKPIEYHSIKIER